MNNNEVYGVTMKDLLEAGVHFGHQAQVWHPKIAPYIYSRRRNNIHIINLEIVLWCLGKACEYLKSQAQQGKGIIFVGTKKIAQDIIKEEAERSGVYYVISRWIGGTLTNFEVILKSIELLEKLREQENSGEWLALPKKERQRLQVRKKHLEQSVGGLVGMRTLPAALFVVDAKKEHIAIAEAAKTNVKVVAMVDTNSNPQLIDYCIPSNDDAIKSIRLITKTIANAIIDGKGGLQGSADACT